MRRSHSRKYRTNIVRDSLSVCRRTASDAMRYRASVSAASRISAGVKALSLSRPVVKGQLFPSLAQKQERIADKFPVSVQSEERRRVLHHPVEGRGQPPGSRIRPVSSFSAGAKENGRGQNFPTNRPSPLPHQYGHAKKSTYTAGDYLGIKARAP